MYEVGGLENGLLPTQNSGQRNFSEGWDFWTGDSIQSLVIDSLSHAADMQQKLMQGLALTLGSL